MRTEQDLLGEVLLPDDALYGAQTARAKDNFALGEQQVNLSLIYAIVTVKKAAAVTYRELDLMESQKCDAIISACDDVLAGRVNDAFITHPLQGGAGTSTNMNVNEVLGNLALQKLGKTAGEYSVIHPLDDINRGQSTNDVYPTALRIASIWAVRTLSDECAKLQEALQKKEQEYADVLKLGRTELMDAMPITLGQEFGAYAQAIARDRWRIYKAEERLRQVSLGGTAVGTGSLAERRYAYKVIEVLRDLTGIGLAKSEYPMDITQNNDVFVEVSGLLKALAVSLMKISTDLRLMNSGPKGGLAEIILPKLQMGSTIMPGKVNPVIPEMVTQVAIRVIANDTAISMAAANGNFELNAFMPLIAHSLLESLELLTASVKLFRTKCIELVVPNVKRCREHLERSMVLIASLAPAIGYDNAADIYRECGNDPEKIRELVLEKRLLSPKELDNLLDYKKSATYRNM
ncbi:aspartate ammonia-lyase [Acetanaerobacterium elongatum]|uniref:Aspartate ammonia-lyase n=1 Tax=Acetanaerobacterium elongatum TaxID=258515 RepID=A0A1G9ZDT9_9FIRM|nr:aspartate ammonia-lyase [Acetanaerobacterium elongatum]SDN18633.1 aspartate ammonia-lyase [Acetanaerobacterium elongatum]